MNRSRPLLYSILLHASAIGVIAALYSAVQHVPRPGTRISVSLMTPAPSTAPIPEAQAAPSALPPAPQRSNPLPEPKPQTPRPEAIKPSPVHTPAAPAAEFKPAAPAMPTPQPSMPQSAAVPPKPSPVAAPEPPPPPVNVQAKYEEENLGRIRAILAQRRTYPKNALRLNQQGDVTVGFELTPSGEVENLRILHSSEFELLDNAARTLIQGCAPEFPKPSKTVRITVPISYSIR